MRYLYGAAVQGIQNFIFQTNELKDIVGASELVEQICRDELKALLGSRWKADNSIIGAAGNVKYVFDEEEELKAVFLEFPKRVMTKAPGITISQAVVKYDADFSAVVNSLEMKLRAQRNKPARSITMGLMGVKRAGNTGLPVVVADNGRLMDASTQAKIEAGNQMVLSRKSFYGVDNGNKLNRKQLVGDISDMTAKNDWIAVIHADGNGLGQVVQKVGQDEQDYRAFSEALEAATVRSANDAFEAVKVEFEGEAKIPIRPIVLGGDDLTVIIRGDLAMPYLQQFLQSFERYTGEGVLRELLNKYGIFANKFRLTACAGVAFTKSSYPFYYGYELAEQLCTEAKTKAKAFAGEGQLPPSCLMFHKVQDSFVMRYEDIVKRELRPTQNILFKYGPYYLSDGEKPNNHFTIDELTSLARSLADEQRAGVRSGVRQWLKLLYENTEAAAQRLERLISINEGHNVELITKLTTPRKCRLQGQDTTDGKVGPDTYPAFDVLAYYTIEYQKTKKEHDEDH